jgi:hypothetical protein
MKLLNKQFFYPLNISSHIGPYILFRTMFSVTPSVSSFLDARDKNLTSTENYKQNYNFVYLNF